jgi:ethanolamine utilization protein EutN
MNLGKVIGTVVSAQQHPFYEGRTQLVVRFVRPDGSFDGDQYIVAIDRVGAGVGETVLIQDEGNSARQMMETGSSGPIRSLVVGIVDAINTFEQEQT